MLIERHHNLRDYWNPTPAEDNQAILSDHIGFYPHHEARSPKVFVR